MEDTRQQDRLFIPFFTILKIMDNALLKNFSD